ncbi:MAG: DUF1036 domain-containing protein [Pseudomonadota bacterium]
MNAKLKALLIASMAICLSLPALAQSGSNHSSDNFTSGWRLCNESRHAVVFVAYSYFANGDWVTKGWRRIDRGKCSVFQNEITNKTAYYYAISEDETAQWDGDVNFCAHPKEQFEYSGDVSSCPSGQKNFPFYALKLDGEKAVTRNLTSN